MHRYRLKKEAVPFFKEDLVTKVLTVDQWSDFYHVDQNALEEVKPAYITFGLNDPTKNHNSLGGWSNPESNDAGGSHYHFTIHFPSMSFREHDEFSKGRVVREMMDQIQSQLDYFYEQFNFKNK